MRSKIGSIKIAGFMFFLSLGSSVSAQDSVGDDSTVRYPAAYFEEWAPVTAQDMMDRIPGLSNSGGSRGGFSSGGRGHGGPSGGRGRGGVALVAAVAGARYSLTASARPERITAPAVSSALLLRIRLITSRSYAALPVN